MGTPPIVPPVAAVAVGAVPVIAAVGTVLLLAAGTVPIINAAGAAAAVAERREVLLRLGMMK